MTCHDMDNLGNRSVLFRNEWFELVALTGIEPGFSAFSCVLQVTETAISGTTVFAGISSCLYKICTWISPSFKCCWGIVMQPRDQAPEQTFASTCPEMTATTTSSAVKMALA